MNLEQQIILAEKKVEELKSQRKETIFRYSRNGKRYKVNLPQKVRFIKTVDSLGLIKPAEFEAVGFRRPKKGEFYLSGADICAYLAYNDLSTEYILIERKD